MKGQLLQIVKSITGGIVTVAHDMILSGHNRESCTQPATCAGFFVSGVNMSDPFLTVMEQADADLIMEAANLALAIRDGRETGYTKGEANRIFSAALLVLIPEGWELVAGPAEGEEIH